MACHAATTPGVRDPLSTSAMSIGAGASAKRRSRRRLAALLRALAAMAAAVVLLAFSSPPSAATEAAVAPTRQFLVNAPKARSQLLDAMTTWNRGAVPPPWAPRGSTPFHVALSRDWSRVYPSGTTVIAQARGGCIHVEAACAAVAVGDEREASFVAAMRGGVVTLLSCYRDKTDGGDVWAVVDATKDGSGNAHVLFALAAAVGVLPPGDTDRAVAVVAARERLASIRSSPTDAEGGY
ncbi:hypothetical protein MMPV_000452 [Pyropia vietnamensis]